MIEVMLLYTNLSETIRIITFLCYLKKSVLDAIGYLNLNKSENYLHVE